MWKKRNRIWSIHFLFSQFLIFIIYISPSATAAEFCIPNNVPCFKVDNSDCESVIVPCNHPNASTTEYVPGKLQTLEAVEPFDKASQKGLLPKKPGDTSFSDAGQEARKAQAESQAAADAAKRNADLNRKAAVGEQRFLDDITSNQQAARAQSQQVATNSPEKRDEFLKSEFKSKAEFQSYYKKLEITTNGDLLGEKTNQVVKNLEQAKKDRSGYIKNYEQQAAKAEQASKKLAELAARNFTFEKNQNSLQKNGTQLGNLAGKKNASKGDPDKSENAKGASNAIGAISAANSLVAKKGEKVAGLEVSKEKNDNDKKIDISSGEIEKTKLELLKKLLGKDESGEKGKNGQPTQVAASNLAEQREDSFVGVGEATKRGDKKEEKAGNESLNISVKKEADQELSIFNIVSRRIHLSVATW